MAAGMTLKPVVRFNRRKSPKNCLFRVRLPSERSSLIGGKSLRLYSPFGGLMS